MSFILNVGKYRNCKLRSRNEMISTIQHGNRNYNSGYNKFEIGEITDRLWRPKEISERIDDVTPRQITDLAENKIIEAAMDTIGAGTTRLYDGAGIYSIMIATALRKVLNPTVLKTTIKCIFECEGSTDFKGTKNFKPELVVIHPFYEGTRANFNITIDAHLTFFYQKNDPDLWDTIMFHAAEPVSKSYLSNVVLLHQMKKFLKRNFN